MSGESAVTNGPRTVSLADEEAVKQILVSTVYGLWDVVNNLTLGYTRYRNTSTTLNAFKQDFVTPSGITNTRISRPAETA